MTQVNLAELAKLARLELNEDEAAQLQSEIPAILSFVESIRQADIAAVEEVHALRNVMRDDGEPHESGRYTEDLLSQAPMRDGDRVAVKQVISRDRGRKSA